MSGFKKAANPCRLAVAYGLASALIAIFLLDPDTLLGQGRVIIGQPQLDPESQFYGGQGIYLPMERTLTRGVRQAEEDLSGGQYSRAIEFLVELLEREEDLFLSVSDETKDARGLKSHARHLIRELPPQGRVVYEVQNEARARKQLAIAVQERDDELLARIARHYFDTPAGYESAWILAQLETDRGHWSIASLIYQDLLDSERARRALGPQLLVQAALHQIAGGQADRARQLLDQYRANYTGMVIEVDGREVPVSELESLLLASLHSEIDATTKGQPISWTQYRGNNARLSVGQGGLPLIRERWRVRVVNEPRAEGYLAGRELEFRGQDLSALPVASPIAVDDVVVFSTPRNIVAIDWDTGKRIWETRPDPNDRFEEVVEGLAPNDGQEEGQADALALDQRIWEDAVTVALSSDGDRVYTIRGSPISPQEHWDGWAGNVLWGGSGSSAIPSNRLSAFDLATEGKLVWEIDGSRSTGSFESIFFLGAPLALDGTLYVLGEVNGAVYLFALAPSTGNLLWQQQVANLERGIGFDPARRLAGANLAYADGILVCPTGAGMVVGVDLLNRSLVWAYSIQSEVQSTQLPLQVWQRPRARHLDQGSSAWQDTVPLISDGRVLMMSPGSSDLHCIALDSGQHLWKADTQKALYLACVVDDVVLVVESHAVRGIRLSDGTAAWETARLTLASGSLPSGKGFVSEGRYLLPLSSGEVLSIDVATGKTEATVTAREGLVLGNLIYYRDAVVSQNALFLDKFEQAEALERRALATLEDDPHDANALRDLGELRLASGDLDQAKDYLIRAHERDDRDRLVSELLAECMLSLLNTDFTKHRDDLELLRSLVYSREHEIELLRIEIQGYSAAGEPKVAFEKCLRLIETIRSKVVMLPLARQYEVRSDVWIRQQIATIWAAAGINDRRGLQQLLDSWRSSAPIVGIDSLETFLTYFGDFPNASGGRIELASQLVKRRNAPAAELELLKLQHSDREDARAAGLLMSELTKSQKLSVPNSTAANWPAGNWTAKVTPASPRRRSHDRRNDFNRQQNLRELRIEQVYGPKVGSQQFFLNGDHSLLIGSDQRGETTFRAQLPGERARLPQLRQFNTHYGARLGHLLFVSLGTKIAVLDTWRTGEDEISPILWQETLYSEHRFANAGRARSTVDRSRYDYRSGRKRLAASAGQLVGVLGPVTPEGIVYQAEDRLLCADPLTGRALWMRRDIPAGCELFGDENVVCAVPPGQDEGYVLSLRDGRILDNRPFPAAPWLMTSGSRVVSLRQGGGKLSISISEAATGDEILHVEFDAYAQFHVVEPNRFAVMEPSGRFRLIDVSAAAIVLDQSLLPETSLRDIRILTDRDRLFLFVNREVGAQHNPHMTIGVDYPLLTGPVYAFDMDSGEQIWSAPATVSHRGIVLPLPDESPLLCFVDRIVRQGPSGSVGSLRVLCLEKATGRSIYLDDALTDTAGGRFQVRMEPEEPAVIIETSASTIRLTRKDGPRPPEPPAQYDVESRPYSQGGGLWEIGRRMGDAIQNALEDAQGQPDINAEGLLQEHEVPE